MHDSCFAFAICEITETYRHCIYFLRIDMAFDGRSEEKLRQLQASLGSTTCHLLRLNTGTRMHCDNHSLDCLPRYCKTVLCTDSSACQSIQLQASLGSTTCHLLRVNAGTCYAPQHSFVGLPFIGHNIMHKQCMLVNQLQASRCSITCHLLRINTGVAHRFSTRSWSKC